MANECCLGLIQAKHIPYELLAHFGPACLSQDLRELPQIEYIFPRNSNFSFENLELNIKKFAEDLNNKKEDSPILILADQDLQHLNDKIFEIFSNNYNEKKILYMGVMPKNSLEISKNKLIPLFLGYYSNYEFNKDKIDESTKLPYIVFIGKSSSHLLLKIGLLLGKLKYKSFNVIDDLANANNETDSITLNKELMKRFALIEKSKDKEIFGILINSPTIQGFQETFQRVKNLLRIHNKKFYNIMINNITEAKLGNFPDVQVFISISCHNHSLYSEKDFYRIIITPYELELALDQDKSWENTIVLDHSFGFKDILEKEEEKKEENLEKKQDFSVVLKNQNDQIQVRQIFQTLDLFEQKTFKGLDITQEAQVGMAVQGLHGIASEYSDEKEKK